MRLRGDQNLFVALLTGLCIPLVGYGYPIPGFIIAFVGLLFLVRKKYYPWTAIIIFFLVIISSVTYRYPMLNAHLPIIAFFLVSLSFEYSIYRFRVKNHLKKVLTKMNEDASFELLPFNVSTYYRNLYSFHRPYMVRIWRKKNNKEMDKGYFDLKKDTLVICEPALSPVYTEPPEKVWENVVKIHSDQTPKKIEFRDKYELLVGVDVYEDGMKTSESWRLKKSLYETWNSEKEEWIVQPRGWTPKKSFFERITGQ